jgi:hypothetical protein
MCRWGSRPGWGVMRRRAAEQAKVSCVVELRTRPVRRASSRCKLSWGVICHRGADPAGASSKRHPRRRRLGFQMEMGKGRGREERGRMSGWVGFLGFHILHPRCAPTMGGRMTFTNLPLGQWRVGPNLLGPTRQPLKGSDWMFHVAWWWAGVHLSLTGGRAERGWVGYREGHTGGHSFEMRFE